MNNRNSNNLEFKIGIIKNICIVVNDEQKLNLIIPFVKYSIIINHQNNFEKYSDQLNEIEKFIFVDCIPNIDFYKKFNCIILEALPLKGFNKCFDVFNVFQINDAEEIFKDILQNTQILKTKSQSVVNLTRKIATNDIDFVKDFRNTYNDVLCFIPENGTWVKFNKCVGWQEIPNKTIIIAITTLINEHINLINKNLNLTDKQKTYYISKIKSILTANKISKIIELIKIECTVSLNQFINNNSITFINGVINFNLDGEYTFNMFNSSQKIMDHRTNVIFNCKENLNTSKEIIQYLLNEEKLNYTGFVNAIQTAIKGNDPKIYIINTNCALKIMLLESIIIALGDYGAKICLQNGNVTANEMRSLIFKRLIMDKNFNPTKIKKILPIKQLIGNEPFYINGSKKINIAASIFIINNKFRNMDFLKSLNINENLIKFIDMKKNTEIMPAWQAEDFENTKKTVLDFIINFRHI